MNKQNVLTNPNEDKLIDILKACNLYKENNFRKCDSFNRQKLKKVTLNSIKNQRNQNSKLLKNNNITEISLLKYKPKRLLKLSEQGNSVIPFTNLGGSSFDLEKTFSSDDNKYKLKININQNDNEKLLNSNNDTEFKSTYFFRFSKNLKDFNKLNNFCELIEDNNDKRIFKNIFDNISKLIESQNKLLFNYIDLNTNNSANNSKNISMINNYEKSPVKIDYLNTNSQYQHLSKSNSDLINVLINSNSSNNINKYSNINNSEVSSIHSSSPNLNLNFKKLVIFWSNFIVLINKLLSQIFTEFSKCKKDNIKLKKKSYRDELNLNYKMNELDDLKKYMNRFDVNLKINQQITKQEEISELKKDFKKKENEYILLIYKLENDIKDLTLLLERNKDYYNQYKDISKDINKTKKQCELLKIKFNKELKSSNTKILVEKDYQKELNIQIEELKEEINKKEKEIEDAKNKNIELKAIIINLETIITEKKENILMLYQEFEYFMRKYNEEKSNLKDIKNEFKALEKKLNKYVEKEKEEKLKKEKRIKKNKIKENKDLNPISPKHNKKEDNNASPSSINIAQSNDN
jgi:hypothetical protein